MAKEKCLSVLFTCDNLTSAIAARC